MNISNWQHALYGLLMLLPFAVIGSPEIGCAWSIAWFVSREHTQREIQICAERMCNQEDLRWWDGFTGWTNHKEPAKKNDRWLDVIFPAVFCSIATIGYYIVKG